MQKIQLSKKSVNFEQNILKEIVGSQDQIAAAYGGFNSIKFNKDGSYIVRSLKLKNKAEENLNKKLLLLYTGNQRRAHDIAKTYVKDLSNNKKKEMRAIQEFVFKDKVYLKNGSLDDFGDLLNESWYKKKELSKNISSNLIDSIYSKALKNGALGGKILGAGGGGFFLFYVRENKLLNFKRTFSNYPLISFKFEKKGSHTIFNSEKNND